ncbi:secretory lipase-domain-containing protein [Hypoxylon sp. FL1150]|nr:secretory lipase-domain-containing protein [Hypoxylon sp. FL1150]
MAATVSYAIVPHTHRWPQADPRFGVRERSGTWAVESPSFCLSVSSTRRSSSSLWAVGIGIGHKETIRASLTPDSLHPWDKINEKLRFEIVLEATIYSLIAPGPPIISSYSVSMMAPSTIEVTSSIGSDHLLPTRDPWYTAPAGFETSTPGTVLRIRTVPGKSTSFRNAAASYHILYRTTGSRYQPTWAVTSLMIPKKAVVSSSGYNALLSVQIAYNTPTIDFSPSYRVFQPPLPNNYGIPTDNERLNMMLGNGWYITIPDFEGPRAAFGATVQAGHATLDGIRAVLSLTGHADVLLPSSADKFKYAMWGYSGGSLASEKAAELQVQYAPELGPNFVGAAVGGLVSSLSGLFTATNKTPYAGNIVLVLLGVMNEYPEVDEYLRSRLKTEGPQDAAAFLKGLEMNSLLAFNAYRNQDIFDYFVGGKADIEACQVLRKIEKVEWTLGYHGAPEIPLFVYKAIGDEMTPIADTDAHMEHYKRFGVSVLYERNTAGGHIPEIVNGQDRAMRWLAGVFAGPYDKVEMGVKIRDVTVDLYKPPTF